MLKDKTLKYNWILSVVSEGERNRILSRILVRKCYWNVGIKHFSGKTQKWQEGEKANELTFSDIYFNIMHYVIAQQFVLRWHYLNTLWRQFRVKFSHAIAWSAHSIPLRTHARALSQLQMSHRDTATKDQRWQMNLNFIAPLWHIWCLCECRLHENNLRDKFTRKIITH